MTPAATSRAGAAALPASACAHRGNQRRAPAAAALVRLAERGLLPDSAIRIGIRRLVRQRLRTLELGDAERAAEQVERLVHDMSAGPIALLTHKANEQHYELPVEFYRLVLGRRLKYSCGYWPSAASEPSLDEAEAAALQLTCERARLADGQQILELGCGWGSLTLWIAEHYPRSRITAVSNSQSQREFILEQAARRGLGNVIVIARDINEFDPRGARFERVVSVEMFEHLRNWPQVFRRVHRWLEPGGLFFLHVFAHRSAPYFFEVADSTDWMAAYFFSGGMMPSDELAVRVCGPLQSVSRWRWAGSHYRRTAEGWLANLDAHRDEALSVLRQLYGADAQQWLQRWRMFFMACAELFGYAAGQEWGVSHYLFARAGEG